MKLIVPKPASEQELNKFHSEQYIDCIKVLSQEDDSEKHDRTAEKFGLCYDCPAWPGVYEYASMIAGATLAAAAKLVNEECDIAINWHGGWHHAKRDEAAGFCYFNDIVLGILKLRERYERVFYIDLDLHHGDGVEDAFCATPKVMTLSMHKFSPGFFPGTGALEDIGYGKGKFYTVNVPLREGMQDKSFVRIFKRLASKIKEQFNPKAVVCQCGADGLHGDPHESFNLSHLSLGECVKTILDWNLPTLLLGGGGYNLPNTAKCWTYLTGIVQKKTLDTDIPEHVYFTKYGPDYELAVSTGYRQDENTEEYIEEMLAEILDNLDEVMI
ncbi:histone deacetylase 8-like [Lineus longissimus]|uniref:histone deacetylase 8-like n=1 Tax=Lineus longissimus TaxID=88925 RepID=UPI00315CA4CC